MAILTDEANFVKVFGMDKIKNWYFNPKKIRWKCDTCGKVYDIDEDAYMCCSKVSPYEEVRDDRGKGNKI